MDAANLAVRTTLAFIYVRVSAFRKGDSTFSLAAQLFTCRRYVADNGWEVGGEFSDVMSGYRDDRPQYRALLDEVRRPRADGRRVVVVVATLDRLGRRMLEGVRCRKELKALGIPIYSVREGGELSDLVANIVAAVAEDEIQREGERVASIFRHTKEMGWHIHGSIPWGYRPRPATPAERAESAQRSVIEVDPLAAPAVVEMFRRAAAGEGINSLERWVATLPTDVRGGRALNHTSVGRILRSPVYVGRVLDGDRDILARPKARWPALVDELLWQQVQERLDGPVTHHATGRYLLSGFLRCPACGHIGGAGALRNGFAMYVCAHQDNALRACYTYISPVRQVDEAVLKPVHDLVTGLAEVCSSSREAADEIWARIPRLPDFVTQRRERLETKRDRARERLKRAGQLLVDGRLDQGGYELVRDRLLDEITAVEEDLSTKGRWSRHARLPPLSNVFADAPAWATIFQTGDIPSRRRVLERLVDHVEAIALKRRTYQVTVIWTPLGESLRRLVEDLAPDREDAREQVEIRAIAQ